MSPGRTISERSDDMKKRVLVAALLIASMLSPAVCAESADRDTLAQVSLLQGLTLGDYHGSITAEELKKHGDTGIGTFDALNGELLMLNGVIYRAAGDGSVEVVPDDETIPFANVTFFDTDVRTRVKNISGISSVKAYMDKKAEKYGRNRFYMVKITGTFSDMYVRSEIAQKEPYKPLAGVLETDQREFEYKNIKGTVVGLYCPGYMDGLNAVGWHFHFISDDTKAGGHVLDLKADNAFIEWDCTDEFDMLLPDTQDFHSMDLAQDQSEDIRKVETGER